ncbi:MAG: 4-(cytidine 5'-diphospho)-2-C-methyl-D-erythritol kinase [Eubacteriales bacterium]|nr:4-(cytidine 5'-diphospho)-2-C-methyl-D-erythritol kinase [Eubacteriales bacterium]
MMDKIHEEGHAKINLCLDVIRKNEDGYHEVCMLMQELGLCDEIILSKIGHGIELEVKDERGVVSDKLQEVPCDERNIAYKAAKLLMEEYDIKEGVSIELIKRIPAAAGLAGGSTDAAAVLRGMNRLFELNIDGEELCRLGKRLGADIPFCIIGGTCLAEGIGEKLSPLDSVPALDILLVKPGRGVSTKAVYEGLDIANRKKEDHPDTVLCYEAIKNGDVDKLIQNMGNILELVTVEYVTEIKDIEKKMLECGAVKAMMSGSGPTVFGIFEDKASMHRAFEEFNKSAWNDIVSDVIETETRK